MCSLTYDDKVLLFGPQMGDDTMLQCEQIGAATACRTHIRTHKRPLEAI